MKLQWVRNESGTTHNGFSSVYGSLRWVIREFPDQAHLYCEFDLTQNTQFFLNLDSAKAAAQKWEDENAPTPEAPRQDPIGRDFHGNPWGQAPLDAELKKKLQGCLTSATGLKEYRDRRERLVGHLQELRRSMQESVDSIYGTSMATLDVLDAIIQRSDREAGK